MPDVDPLLALLVDRALAFHPNERWQSAPEMQDAVHEVAMAASGPLGVPMLQGPRVSVEVDLAAVGEARGRWASSSFSALRPSIVREPARPTLLLRPPRRRSRALVVATVAAAGILVGALAKQAWLEPGRALGRSAPEAKAAPITGPAGSPNAAPAAPSEALASSHEVPSVLLPPGAGLLPSEGGPALASAGDEAEVVPEANGEASKPRRRIMRRLVPSTAAGGPSSGAAQSAVADDALWGRRH
jgi:hypothetical protein